MPPKRCRERDARVDHHGQLVGDIDNFVARDAAREQATAVILFELDDGKAVAAQLLRGLVAGPIGLECRPGRSLAQPDRGHLVLRRWASEQVARTFGTGRLGARHCWILRFWRFEICDGSFRLGGFAQLADDLEYLFDRGDPFAHFAEAVVAQRDHALPAAARSRDTCSGARRR